MRRRRTPSAASAPLPLAVVVGIGVAVRDQEHGVGALMRFAAGALPFCLLVLRLNHALYGSPVRTGKDLLGIGGSALVHAKSEWLGVLQGGAGAGAPGRITPTSVVLHSIDGLRWSQRRATGLDGGEITDLAWVGGRFVAVGFDRPTLGPAQPTPIPLAWWSADGDAWHEVALPLPEGAHGMAAGVAVAGTRLVAVGYDDAGAAYQQLRGYRQYAHSPD